MSYGKILLIAFLMISFESFAGSLSALVGGGASGGAGKTLRKQIFTSSGTWVRPPGVEVVSMVECMGGGQAGANGNSKNSDIDSCSTGVAGGQGGASGHFVVLENLSVSSDVVVTTGQGGISNGDIGSSSSFGNLLVAQGGQGFSSGGSKGLRSASASGGYTGSFSDLCSANPQTLPSSLGLGLGETPGTQGNSAGCGTKCVRGGGGGGSGHGNGGSGGNVGYDSNGSSGGNGGLGAGGGGGGGCVKLGGCVAGLGGSGGNGYCAVYWWD